MPPGSSILKSIGTNPMDEDDDNFINDRTRRFLQSFALDDDDEHDDEFVILSSTGQEVGLKQLLHKSHNPKASRSASPQLQWNYCRSSDSDASTTLFNKLLCTPLSYALKNRLSGAAFVIISLACWLVLYYRIRPFIVKAKRKHHSRQILSVVSSTFSKSGDTCMQARIEPPQPSLADKPPDARIERDINDVPDLVTQSPKKDILSRQPLQDASVAESEPEYVAISPRSSNKIENRSVISIPGPIRTTIDDARHALTLIAMYEQACAEQGRVCDHSAALQWAAQQQKSEKILNARREEELRRYLWDNTQRTIDRSLSQNQHDEKISVSREDKDWQQKLLAYRDKCHSALICALYHCFAGAFLIAVSRPILILVYLWSTLSSTEMVCYGSGTSFDPKVSLFTSSLGRYASYAYTDTWTSALLGETATCLTYTMGRVGYVFAAFLALYLASWILKHLVVLESVQNLIKSAILLLILSICGWVPEHLMYRILFCLGVVSSACYVIIQLKFQGVRTHFRKMNTVPQTSVVNNSLEWFDDATEVIRMMPFIAFGGLILFLASHDGNRQRR